VYSSAADDFSQEVTPSEVKKMTEKNYEKVIPSMLDPSVDTTIIITESFSPNRVKKILLKEEWFFDKQRSVLDVRILGICPLYEQEDKEKGDQPLFWVYFPEARKELAKYDVFNRQNPQERRSFDDIFWKRQFSSYIIQEENVYNRAINEYKKGMDALLESNRIKDEIITFEHDLWEF
jgi:gliding motility associated protien GldN